MKFLPLHLIALALAAMTWQGCETAVGSDKVADKTVPAPAISFNDYWYAGQAEITSYKLEQARYGELHEGSAVLVYVTEDFSRSKQVKLDNAGQAGADAVPILKLNLSKKFNTGVYPYSMMQSVFSPVDTKNDAHALKVTASSQEWCGHTFSQLNQGNDKWNFQLHSYFESEGEQHYQLDKVWLEDELWNYVRLSPDKLPTGTIQIIPGMFAARLRHRQLKPVSATASLEASTEHTGQNVYTLQYGSDRSLSIRFNKTFPHEVEGWTETYVSGWGAGAKKLTTTATRNQRIQSDYWNRHSVADSGLRKELGLE